MPASLSLFLREAWNVKKQLVENSLVLLKKWKMKCQKALKG